MAVDRPTIDSLFFLLDDYIFRIQSMDFTQETISEDKDIQDLICHRLQVAVEITIDIAMHLASGLNLPAKDSAVDIFKLLAKEKVISDDLAKRMAEATRFRNLVVHGYGKIDFKRVAREYTDDLKDLKEFTKTITDFLEKNPQV